MLGTYNVNGAPCELLVDQDALTWWPTTISVGHGNSNGQDANSKSSQLSSPIRHLKRLSNGPKHEDGNQADSLKERKRRRIDFDQIIGLVKVSHFKKRRGSKKRPPGDRKHATTCDEAKTMTAKQDVSEIRKSNGRPSDGSNSNFTGLKVYYVKRSEKKSTGRLMKLKKIIINSVSQTTTTSSLHHHTIQDQEMPASSSSSSSFSCGSTASSDQRGGQLEGLCDLIEQHLELKRRQRPKRLLVFVNPFGGKGKALHLYKSRVRKILDLAQVECQLVVTKYANHARDTIEDPMFDLDQFDGVICIGGDGMFAELMNGLLFRFNRDKLLSSELKLINKRLSDRLGLGQDEMIPSAETERNQKTDTIAQADETTDNDKRVTTVRMADESQSQRQLKHWRSLLGGIGEQFQSPNIPIGVIGAGSTDANLFGFIGTNDTISATLNIILGNQIQIDVSSIHSLEDDRLLRFVSTFVAYGYFGDVIRESEKLRWLGPSRYDVTALNSLIKYRNYNGLVRILRSTRDGTPLDLNRCHLNCGLCRQMTSTTLSDNNNHLSDSLNLDYDCDRKKEEGAGRGNGAQQVETIAGGESDEFEIIEEEGSFVGVNAAVTACRCPQTRKGFSPGNHLANGCADLILVRSCSRIQYINYLIRTGFTSKSAFDLGYVDAYRCRQFEFIVQKKEQSANWSNNHSSSDDTATSDYQSKGSTKLSTNTDTSIGSSRQSSNTNSLDSKLFGGQGESQPQPRSSRLLTSDANVQADRVCYDDGSSSSNSSWNADGEILHEQSIRVKVNNKLLRVFGTGEPQPRLIRRKQRASG